MLDMSKAFDTVDRNALHQDLVEVPDQDKLQMMTLLLKDVELQVRFRQILGEPIKTNIGVPQGDCAN